MVREVNELWIFGWICRLFWKVLWVFIVMDLFLLKWLRRFGCCRNDLLWWVLMIIVVYLILSWLCCLSCWGCLMLYWWLLNLVCVEKNFVVYISELIFWIGMMSIFWCIFWFIEKVMECCGLVIFWLLLFVGYWVNVCMGGKDDGLNCYGGFLVLVWDWIGFDILGLWGFFYLWMGGVGWFDLY